MDENHPSASENGSRFDFDRIAPGHDDWYDTPAGRLYDMLERRGMAGALGDRRAGLLLDMGCGSGHWSSFFCFHGYTVYGTDISREMLRQARARGSAGAYVVSDGCRLPFRTGCFDATVFVTSLEFVRDAADALREAVRCTRRPGGRVVVGALNAESGLNRRRKARRGGPYASSAMFTAAQLQHLLSGYGTAKVKVTAFVPALLTAVPLLARLYNRVMEAFRASSGDFLAGEVLL